VSWRHAAPSRGACHHRFARHRPTEWIALCSLLTFPSSLSDIPTTSKTQIRWEAAPISCRFRRAGSVAMIPATPPSTLSTWGAQVAVVPQSQCRHLQSQCRHLRQRRGMVTHAHAAPWRSQANKKQAASSSYLASITPLPSRTPTSHASAPAAPCSMTFPEPLFIRSSVLPNFEFVWCWSKWPFEICKLQRGCWIRSL
jgi:hypothetical protein